MAAKTKKELKEEVKDVLETVEETVEETELEETKETKEPEPEKEGLLVKAKKFGKWVLGGAKKAAPVAGGIVIGAGMTIGAIAVALAKGEAIDSEVPLIDSNDMAKADDFIEGEAEVVNVDES